MLVDKVKRLLAVAILNLLALLPLLCSRWLGKLIGHLNYVFESRAAKVTFENLTLSFPRMQNRERQRLARLSLVHTGQTMMETPAVWLADLKRLKGWISRIEDEHLLDEAIGLGRGVIVLLPHLGNWEMFNVYFATRGTMTALYQPPRQGFLKPVMQDIRRNFGNEMVATSVKGLARLYRCLENGQVVTILPDQVPATGEYAPFFNEPALTDVLVSRLLRRTGAKAVCCTVRREGSKFVVSFSSVDERIYSHEEGVSVLGLNVSIENSISDHLEQYQWEYKRFRERPSGMKKLYGFKGRPDEFHS